MSNNVYIKTALVDILNNKKPKQPGRVLLLTGPWGAGKTHFWKNEIVPSLQRTHLYVSAFGVESSSQLKTRLVTQYAVKAARDAAGSSGVKDKANSWLSRISPSALRRTKHALSTAADAAINAVLSKITLDPIELVELFEADVIVCVDDIERISSKYRIDELLGIVNILSEHKGMDVVLICNEEHLMETDRNTYLRYKEKTVSTQHKIGADLDGVFDNLLSGFGEATQKDIRRRKDHILRLMRHCGSSNIRSLRRVFDYFSYLHGLGIFEISESHADFLVALTMESSEGRIKDVGFYDFNEFVMRMSLKIDGREQRESEIQKQQLEFLERYGLEERYSFVESLYSLVRSGEIKADALKLELIPPAPVVAADESVILLEQVTNGGWRFYSDAQALELINGLYKVAAENEDADAAKIFQCLRYARFLSEILGFEPSDEVLSNIKDRLVWRGTRGDASASGRDDIIHHEESDRYVVEELRMYMEAFEKYKGDKETDRLLDLLRTGRFEELASEFRNNMESTRLFIRQGGVDELLSNLGESPELLFRVTVSLGRTLKSMKNIWPEANECLEALAKVIRGMQDKPDQVSKMQIWRSKIVLKDLAGV